MKKRLIKNNIQVDRWATSKGLLFTKVENTGRRQNCKEKMMMSLFCCELKVMN